MSDRLSAHMAKNYNIYIYIYIYICVCVFIGKDDNIFNNLLKCTHQRTTDELI